MPLQSGGCLGWLTDGAMCGTAPHWLWGLGMHFGCCCLLKLGRPSRAASTPAFASAGTRPSVFPGPLLSLSLAWCFPEQWLFRVPADVPRQKLLPSSEDEWPRGSGTSGKECQDEGYKSIRAKCGAHVPCRGSGMGCLERSGALHAAPEPGEESGVLQTGVREGQPPRKGSRWQCRAVRIRPCCFASSKAQAGPACPPPQLGACPCPRVM